MDLYKIAIRVLFAFIFLQMITRLAGNRTPGQGTVFDFVLALILGDMIDDCLWAEVPVSQFVVGTGTLVAVHILIEIGARRSERFGRLVGSTSLIFMRDGTLIPHALRRERMNRKEAEEMLRHLGLEREDWTDVKEGCIEQNGEPSAELHSWARRAQRGDAEKVRRISP